MESTESTESKIAAAIRRLEERQKYDLEFREQLDELAPFKSREARSQKEKEDYAREMIALVRTGRYAGRFGEELYVYYMNFYVRGIVHEGRAAEGHYQEALARVSGRLAEIRSKPELSSGVLLVKGEGPPEYEELNEEYEHILDSFLPSVFREFGEHELADLLESDPERFEALERSGFNAVHKKTSPVENLARLGARYKREGELAGQAGAYYAGCAMLGAAIEATLLALCYQYPAEAEAARRRLHRDFRPVRDPERWSLLDLVVIAIIAGWIPSLRTDSPQLTTSEWIRRINRLRQFRNLLHPGKHLATTPWIQLGREEYDDARAIFEVFEFQLKRLEPPLGREPAARSSAP